MKKYIITWNIGHGPETEVIEANSYNEAEKYAYESWRENAESNAQYDAQEYSEELAEELGI